MTISTLNNLRSTTLVEQTSGLFEQVFQHCRKSCRRGKVESLSNGCRIKFELDQTFTQHVQVVLKALGHLPKFCSTFNEHSSKLCGSKFETVLINEMSLYICISKYLLVIAEAFLCYFERTGHDKIQTTVLPRRKQKQNSPLVYYLPFRPLCILVSRLGSILLEKWLEAYQQCS